MQYRIEIIGIVDFSSRVEIDENLSIGDIIQSEIGIGNMPISVYSLMVYKIQYEEDETLILLGPRYLDYEGLKIDFVACLIVCPHCRTRQRFRPIIKQIDNGMMIDKDNMDLIFRHFVREHENCSLVFSEN